MNAQFYRYRKNQTNGIVFYSFLQYFDISKNIIESAREDGMLQEVTAGERLYGLKNSFSKLKKKLWCSS